MKRNFIVTIEWTNDYCDANMVNEWLERQIRAYTIHEDLPSIRSFKVTPGYVHKSGKVKS